MRVRKKKWSAKELAENPLVLQLTGFSEVAFNWKEYFDNSNPIHIEAGCGKGRFIATLAQNNPYINYVALEREETVLAAAARLARDVKGVESSLAFLTADVTEMPRLFKPGEVSRMYINFCDPWPRKKWAKRRLTFAGFLEMYELLQIPEIFFKTDNRGLFEFSLSQFSLKGWKMDGISLDLHRDIADGKYEDNIMTEYEEKFCAHGPIYRLEARKNFNFSTGYKM